MPDPTRPSLQEILLGAGERVGDARRDYVRNACGGDAALEAEVLSLLEFDDRTPSILDAGGLGRVVERVMQAPARAAMGLGATIGPYTLVDVIGEGGMGVVYRATQAFPIARDVALKLVRRGFDTDRVVSRFETERQVLARMDHPGIARVYDAGAAPDGRPYFVMELVAGQPITTYADKARLSVRDRVALLRQVCLAVQHAHQKGVIHRDLKPSNVLAARRDDGHDVKVIDFGIAKATVTDDRDTLLTHDGQLVGTPDYMSPEQAGVIDADVDTRTDVYALGVVLYELLAGRRPHEFARATAADIQRVFNSAEADRPSTAVTTGQRLAWSTESVPPDVVARVAEQRASTPARLKRDLMGDLDNIVLKAIEKAPDRRYASMEQFADDLARFLEGRPVMARPATWSYQTQKFIQRHALGVGIAVTGVVFLTAFVAMTVIQSNRLARERDRAVAAEQRARLEAETASRTVDFLTGIFEVNDPSEGRGNSVTARELLDKGAKDVVSRLTDQPALQSRLMVTMGNVYKQLGLYPPAREILQRAVEVREQAADTSGADKSNALDALGDVLRQTSDRKRALEVLTRAVELSRSDPATTEASRASAVNNLGLVLHEMGEHDKAEPLLMEGLALRRRVLAETTGPAREKALDQLAGSLNNIGLLLNAKDRLVEAEGVMRESLALRQSAKEPRPVRQAYTRVSLAMNLMRQGRFVEAEPLLRQAIADRQDALGNDHARTIDAVSELANALHDQGRYDEAEVQYRRVVSSRVNSDDQANYAVALNNLASLLEDRGDFGAARPLLEQSLAIRKSVNGPKHLSVATALNNLGRLHFNLANYPVARDLLGQALALRRERLGADNVLVAATLMTLARVSHAEKRWADAEATCRAALVVMRERLAASHPNIAAAEVLLGRILIDGGKAAEALPMLTHAIEVRSTPPPPAATMWRLAEARLTLGRALVATGQAEQGHALIRDAAPLVVASPSAHIVLKAEARRALPR
jgi:serine/threonine protein kinase/Tfp pilus assembly protein PilF